MKRIALSVLIVFGIAIAANAADWPNWRGPDFNGISPETGINKAWSNKPPAILWKFAMGDKGYAAPSVVNGKVYIIDHVATTDVIRAIDVKTGKGVWEFSHLDARNEAYGFAHTAPAVAQDKIVTVGRYGDVYCLNAKDGTKVWHKNVQKDLGGAIPQFSCSISPVIDGKKVILCPSGKENSIMALDLGTGDVIWKCQTPDGAAYASPVVAMIGKKKQYVVIMNANLFGLDPETGKVLWTQEVKTPHGINAATPSVDGDRVYVASAYDFGSAVIKVDGDKTSEVWRDKKLQSCYSSGLLIKDRIYSSGDALRCIEADTGKQVWSGVGLRNGQFTAVDGTIIAVDAGGQLVMVELNPAAYKELGRVKPEAALCNGVAPVIADKKMFVRSATELICYDLK